MNPRFVTKVEHRVGYAPTQTTWKEVRLLLHQRCIEIGPRIIKPLQVGRKFLGRSPSTAGIFHDSYLLLPYHF